MGGDGSAQSEEGRRAMTIYARDVMQTKVRTVGPTLPLAELERAFLEARVSGFPVVDGDQLVGVVSRSDIVRKLATEQSVAEYVSDYHRDVGGFDGFRATESPEQLAAHAASRLGAAVVEDVMSRTPVLVSPDDPIGEVARQMVERNIHRLPVVHGGRLEGIVTSLDLVNLIAEGSLTPS
jgi:CBS domain-containing protein